MMQYLPVVSVEQVKVVPDRLFKGNKVLIHEMFKYFLIYLCLEVK